VTPPCRCCSGSSRTTAMSARDGHSAQAPTAGRLVVPIDDPAAGRIGVVVTDTSLCRHKDLVDAAVAASGLALRNAKLQPQLRAQLDQVRASRRRIAEAGVTGRRRIERDLHDGLQQRLLAITLTLAEVRATRNDPAVLNLVELVRSEMHIAVQELRDVAHGVLPSTPVQGGLGPRPGRHHQPTAVNCRPPRNPSKMPTFGRQRLLHCM
jgi:signal transduction histidine kinase